MENYYKIGMLGSISKYIYRTEKGTIPQFSSSDRSEHSMTPLHRPDSGIHRPSEVQVNSSRLQPAEKSNYYESADEVLL